MPDDLDNAGRADRLRINVGEDWEVTYWTRKLGCTEADLRAAVQMVGTRAADVARWVAAKPPAR